MSGRSTEEEAYSWIGDVPDEVLVHICSFLDPFGLVRAEIVCHRWRNIVSSDILWKVISLKQQKP